MIYYLIPARKGSKTLPNKNHVLVPVTLKQLVNKPKSNIILSTDDEWLIEQYKNTGIIVHKRSAVTASDTASMKSVIAEVINDIGVRPDDDIVVLYPTYIERTDTDIDNVYSHYGIMGAVSELCCYPCSEYMEMRIDSEPHGKYRRQDYDKVFIYSHYVAVIKAGILHLLDEQLRHKNTSYYKLNEKPRDVDCADGLL